MITTVADEDSKMREAGWHRSHGNSEYDSCVMEAARAARAIEGRVTAGAGFENRGQGSRIERRHQSGGRGGRSGRSAGGRHFRVARRRAIACALLGPESLRASSAAARNDKFIHMGHVRCRIAKRAVRPI